MSYICHVKTKKQTQKHNIMKTFTIEKKRDGQDWKWFGNIYADNFSEAKKEFAKTCKDNLIRGVHGDNFNHHDEDSIKEIEGDTSWFEGAGVYYENVMFLSDADVEDGIETFQEDVYSYRVVEN